MELNFTTIFNELIKTTEQSLSFFLENLYVSKYSWYPKKGTFVISIIDLSSASHSQARFVALLIASKVTPLDAPRISSLELSNEFAGCKIVTRCFPRFEQDGYFYSYDQFHEGLAFICSSPIIKGIDWSNWIFSLTLWVQYLFGWKRYLFILLPIESHYLTVFFAHVWIE